jgi:hypothetical protein
VSMATAGAAGILYFASNDAYRDYQTTLDPQVAEEKKKLVTLLDTATVAALGASGVSLLLSSIFWISRPSVKQNTEALTSLEEEIEILRDELR